MKNQIVDHQIILQRTKEYGNNFTTMSKLWKNYFKIKYNLQVPIEQEDIPFLMQLYKISRLATSPDNRDSMQDMFNYSWIGFNYDQYNEQSKGDLQFIRLDDINTPTPVKDELQQRLNKQHGGNIRF